MNRDCSRLTSTTLLKGFALSLFKADLRQASLSPGERAVDASIGVVGWLLLGQGVVILGKPDQFLMRYEHLGPNSPILQLAVFQQRRDGP